MSEQMTLETHLWHKLDLLNLLPMNATEVYDIGQTKGQTPPRPNSRLLVSQYIKDV